MSALGERLTAQRERLGLTVQKAADDLKVDGWVIDALEAGEYARLGPVVYGKGHLKRYAGLLGLPVDEIAAAYEVQNGAAPVAPIATLPLPPAPLVALGGGTRSWPAAAAALLLLALAVVWLWKPWRPQGVVAAAVVASTRPMPTLAVAPAAAPVAAPAITPAITPAIAPSTPAFSVDALPGAGRARLRFSFSADSWVDVHDAAGRRLFAGSGRANSVKMLVGEAPMSVYLGFASGVQLEVNDRTVAISPRFMAGDVARFEAGADGVLRRDVRTAAATPTAVRDAGSDVHPRG